MSVSRTLAPLRQATRAAVRPSFASLLPHSALPLRSSSLATQTPFRSARAFSVTSVKGDRHSPVAGDAKWRSGAPVSYDEVKQLADAPSDKILLVDVREPNEVALGSIPSSVNLPLSELEKGLRMDEGDFTRVYGFHKPTKQTPLIYYCKAGIRAQTAVDLSKAAGFKWSRNYVGSYDDWVKREQASGNQDD
ncbi:hypothetical protein JCM8547_007162 [Rhodosporidiobolus lusitaniae]